MKTVVLVTCTKDKHKGAHPAGYLYTKSKNFKKYMEYAHVLTDDENIFIISALHGLLSLDSVIDWYDYTLSGKPKSVKETWGKKVSEQIMSRFNVDDTKFIILAGADYSLPLRPYLPNIELPLKGVRIGYRLEKVDALIKKAKNTVDKSICCKLHELFNSMPSYKWDTIDQICFHNGIYILFETGETFYNMHRVVRVGTHKRDGRLCRRLKDHFYAENNDGSIFRKNIGRAILNKNKDPYLRVWTKSSSRSDHNYDLILQKKIEKQVTQYLRDNFSFVCIPVESNTERLRLELGIIASLNTENDFLASPNWLGKYSSEFEIVQSGMWLKEGLNDIPLSKKEYARIEFLCKEAPFMPSESFRKNLEIRQINKFKATYTKKYAPLTTYLSKITSNEIRLSLSEIERIIDSKLPPSAYKYEVWWANDDESHSHRLGWINAGFEVSNGNQIKSTREVIFKRKI